MALLGAAMGGSDAAPGLHEIDLRVARALGDTPDARAIARQLGVPLPAVIESLGRIVQSRAALRQAAAVAAD